MSDQEDHGIQLNADKREHIASSDDSRILLRAGQAFSKATQSTQIYDLNTPRSLKSYDLDTSFSNLMSHDPTGPHVSSASYEFVSSQASGIRNRLRPVRVAKPSPEVGTKTLVKEPFQYVQSLDCLCPDKASESQDKPMPEDTELSTLTEKMQKVGLSVVSEKNDLQVETVSRTDQFNACHPKILLSPFQSTKTSNTECRTPVRNAEEKQRLTQSQTIKAFTSPEAEGYVSELDEASRREEAPALRCEEGGIECVQKSDPGECQSCQRFERCSMTSKLDIDLGPLLNLVIEKIDSLPVSREFQALFGALYLDHGSSITSLDTWAKYKEFVMREEHHRIPLATIIGYQIYALGERVSQTTGSPIQSISIYGDEEQPNSLEQNPHSNCGDSEALEEDKESEKDESGELHSEPVMCDNEPTPSLIGNHSCESLSTTTSFDSCLSESSVDILDADDVNTDYSLTQTLPHVSMTTLRNGFSEAPSDAPCGEGNDRTTSKERQSSSATSTPSKSKRKHEEQSPNAMTDYGHQGNEDEEEEDEDGDGKAHMNKRTAMTQINALISLACPFYKVCPAIVTVEVDKQRIYKSCGSRCFKDIPSLKKHLKNKHRMPEHYCAVCWVSFETRAAVDVHSQDRSCEAIPSPYSYKMDEQAEFTILKKRSKKNQATAKTWYFIFRAIFPDFQPPASPYVEDYTSELHILAATFFDVLGVQAKSVYDRVRERIYSLPLSFEILERAYASYAGESALSSSPSSSVQDKLPVMVGYSFPIRDGFGSGSEVDEASKSLLPSKHADICLTDFVHEDLFWNGEGQNSI